jgi:hypothetical protein
MRFGRYKVRWSTGKPDDTERVTSGLGRGGWKHRSSCALAAYSTATARFYNGYVPAKKWVIVATITRPQSRDFKRYVLVLIAKLPL